MFIKQWFRLMSCNLENVPDIYQKYLSNIRHGYQNLNVIHLVKDWLLRQNVWQNFLPKITKNTLNLKYWLYIGQKWANDRLTISKDTLQDKNTYSVVFPFQDNRRFRTLQRHNHPGLPEFFSRRTAGKIQIYVNLCHWEIKLTYYTVRSGNKDRPYWD